jgi:hypothetical protein
MHRRRSLLSKAFAVWFVVVIVLPFTAPFQVWSDRVPIGKAHSDDYKSPDSFSSDAAIVGSSPFAPALTAGAAIVRAPLHGSRLTPHTLPTVLRL